MSESISSWIDRPNHHLNIVPISHEALLLDISGYVSQENYLTLLKREMEVQEQPLHLVSVNNINESGGRGDEGTGRTSL